MTEPVQPGDLCVIVNTMPCSRRRRSTAVTKAPKIKGGVGKEVEVVGPPEEFCGCCVSVMPLWEDIADRRGLVCRRDNLLKITPDEHITSEQDEEIAA